MLAASHDEQTGSCCYGLCQVQSCKPRMEQGAWVWAGKRVLSSSKQAAATIMISLALDPEVVASAWEQQVGCGSIFSPQASDADFTVPSIIALDLSEIEAGMGQPPQQHHQLPHTDDSGSGAAAATAAMLRPELLLQWDTVLPVPLLPAAGRPWAVSLPSSTCTAAHKLCCVPNTLVRSLSSSASTNDRVCGPRPAALPSPGKCCKLQQSVSAQLAEDAECAVVPDAPGAAAAWPSSSSCSSDGSSGPAADGQDSAAADAPGGASAASAQVPQAPETAVFRTANLGAVPAAASFAMHPPPPQQQHSLPIRPRAAQQQAVQPARQLQRSCSNAHLAKKQQPTAAPQATCSEGCSTPRQRARTAHAAAAAAAASAAAAAAGEPFLRTRAEALARYRQKRVRRTHAKKIRYHLRKVNADKRPRIKGRFVKKDELMEPAADSAAPAAAAGCNGGMWDEGCTAAGAGGAASPAGAAMGFWEQQDDFLQALQLPGVTVETTAADGNRAAAAAPAPVTTEVASAAEAATAAAGDVDDLQMLCSAAPPNSSTSAGANAAAGALLGAAAAVDAEAAAAAAAMDMHLLGHWELAFGELGDDAAVPMLGEDFFSHVHDMTEGSGASHACLLLH
ncbi:hypothetical protein COO60DRAFT_1191356 [Scenedesmus sp. NREL 46B-D3]|nr:hypothetical protein COO60DRAFT_1191356 [Scenedesmus sp. NREL 46B-D3]